MAIRGMELYGPVGSRIGELHFNLAIGGLGLEGATRRLRLDAAVSGLHPSIAFVVPEVNRAVAGAGVQLAVNAVDAYPSVRSPQQHRAFDRIDLNPTVA